MLPKWISDQITKLPKVVKILIEPIINYYNGEISRLEAENKKLKDQQSKNSTNSSKPPSTDGFNKKPKSRRKKTGKKPGGQQGHKGTTLKWSTKVDRIENHKVEFCKKCNRDLRTGKIDREEARQEFEIPPIQLEVIEHRSEVKVCNCGCVNKGFPDRITSHIQYGSRIKALIVYFQNYQLLPYERTKELIQDLFGHCISKGSFYNFSKAAYNKLDGYEQVLKDGLRSELVVGFDETGIRVGNQLLWLHSCSTDDHVYYAVDEKRGREAMDRINILPSFKGIAVHDYWKSYYTYDCIHSLCNAHLLRELIFIEERFEQKWAQEMIDLLLKMLALKNKALKRGQSKVAPQTLNGYQSKYDHIVKRGLKLNPHIPPVIKKRGRPKQTPPRNLLERLLDKAPDILRFLYDFKVPFDNNFTERDLRMWKVKLKISGCFRSLMGALYFARSKGYIMTARKQGVNAYDALISLFGDQTITKQLTAGLGAE